MISVADLSLSDLQNLVKDARNEIYERNKLINEIMESVLDLFVKINNMGAVRIELDTSNSEKPKIKVLYGYGYSVAYEIFESMFVVNSSMTKVSLVDLQRYEFENSHDKFIVQTIYEKNLYKRALEYKSKLDKFSATQLDYTMEHIEEEMHQFSGLEYNKYESNGMLNYLARIKYNFRTPEYMY